MKILFIGDIAWRQGRAAVKYFVPKLREQYQLDLVVANGENARHNNGLSLPIYDELREAGIDWFTGGDHSFSVKDFLPLLDDPQIQVLRPANYPKDTPGRGIAVIKVGSETLTLINLQGRVFMKDLIDDPFAAADQLIDQAQGFVLVDFHAEATSEKNTMGHYLDGRVGAVIGTHTHIQTADERILPKGTAYITDVGMTGPMNGSIGVSIDSVLPGFKTGVAAKFEPASGDIQFNAVLIELEGNQAKSISRVLEVLPSDTDL